MQESLGFEADDVGWWRAQLDAALGPFDPGPRRCPIGQLVRSSLGSRTRDAVSLAAYRRIGRRWPRAALLARAAPPAVRRVIADVTFAEVKAAHIPAALAAIGAERPDFDLDFLATLPLADALAWLERLPGVGAKVAAATLNFSTLALPVFVVDAHVHRVLGRLGFVGPTADPAAASRAMTAALGDAPGTVHMALFAQLKHLGQTICRFDVADCHACPLVPRCHTARTGVDGAPPAS